MRGGFERGETDGSPRNPGTGKDKPRDAAMVAAGAAGRGAAAGGFRIRRGIDGLGIPGAVDR